MIFGRAGIADMPGAAQLRTLTRIADVELLPTDHTDAPADTPLRPNGPIKHVFFIVRENRTYDQVMGDDPRGDGDAGLTLFGRQITPNAHAMASRFPLLDHVMANSATSADGHFWTSAAGVSNYVERTWSADYAGRGRPGDGFFAVSFPQNGFLFDQAARQHISYFNFGEAVGGAVEVPDKDITPELRAAQKDKAAHSDLGLPDGCYPNDTYVALDLPIDAAIFDSTVPLGAPAGSQSRFECFRLKFLTQMARGQVPQFTYISLPNDHTVGTAAGRRTPRAMVADNDWALG